MFSVWQPVWRYLWIVTNIVLVIIDVFYWLREWPVMGVRDGERSMRYMSLFDWHMVIMHLVIAMILILGWVFGLPTQAMRDAVTG